MPVVNGLKILVIGSGFSGSIVAAILRKHGHHITLIDKSSHPRFAIGESSTPTASLILQTLIKQYDLQDLMPLTRYGLWSENLPEVGVGAKRGFSYFFHAPGDLPETTMGHEGELLVAASRSQAMADTHWYRQDVDRFLFDYAVRLGVTSISNSEIVFASYDEMERTWQVKFNTAEQFQAFDWIIDASGAGEVMCRLSNEDKASRPDLVTNTSAVYAHFRNIQCYDDLLIHAGMDISDFPFSSDASAQHHIFTSQWLWSLRFDNGVTSLGLVSDLNRDVAHVDWSTMLTTYPAIQSMFQDSEFDSGTRSLHSSARLQRLSSRGCGPGWVALPGTIGFVDPLHSTGIAHALSGVERLAEIFTQDEVSQLAVNQYTEAVYREFRLIDQLIAGCYHLMPSKRHFEAYCMLYFTAAHNYETCRMKISANAGLPGIFLSDDVQMVELIEAGYHLACEISQSAQWEAPELFEQQIRELIGPFDQIGLCNPNARSMYSYTAIL